jgi:hydrogenase maturation protease
VANVLVIGIGNRYREDDAVGPAVAERLRAQLPPSVGVMTNDGEGLLDLVLELSDVGTAILIDAAASGAEPGTIHRLEGADRAAFDRIARCSTHSFGVVEAVELARALGRLPPRLIVYAVEAESLGYGQGLSPHVYAAVEDVAGRIGTEIARILGDEAAGE